MFMYWKSRWPLPYKSTVVVAIYPDISRPSLTDHIPGFLCIDCEKKNVFIEADDTYLLAGCANGLFNAVKKYKLKTKEIAKHPEIV